MPTLVRNGQIEIIKLLLDKGIDLKNPIDGYKFLMLGLENEHNDVVELLLLSGANYEMLLNDSFCYEENDQLIKLLEKLQLGTGQFIKG